MRYSCEITINLPREQTVALIDNPDNLKHWQDGFQSYEPLTGELGEPGSTVRLRYIENGREVEMVETLISHNLPDEFSARYETNGVYNLQVNRFYADGPNRTRWVSESEFKFGPLMSVVAFFMRGMFRKQSMKFLENFKAFAEGTRETTGSSA